MDQKQRIEAARRVVVKVGSNVLTAADGLNLKMVRRIARQVCGLIAGGREVILVSSGAMAAGVKKVGLERRPDELPRRQAVAAVGQAGLIMEYEKAFERHGRKVAQILLTSEDLSSRKRYLNARNTLNTLLDWKIVPIINENDTVSVEEIKLGDNDNLAAMITLLMDADLLIILSDIDGLFTKDPRTQPDAELIPVVKGITRSTEKAAGSIPGPLGTGGMLSKLNAARKVTAAGVPMVVAKGDTPGIIERLVRGESHGTYFVPRGEKLTRRKCWIAFSLKPKGGLTIDAGARAALALHRKSLLASGIVGVKGEFAVGAPVELQDLSGETIGIGLVNYSAADVRKIMGLKSQHIGQVLGQKPYDEVIHRDNLVITVDEGPESC
ncbi:MAG: glutamate 5-kinase [Desulfobacteraceae bacterium]|nr:MAG: glutamate 5-kinase [Desulfobacteraceae bacterium]